MGITTLAIVSVLVFTATQALPGDVARLILGPDATTDQLLQLRSNLHLDDPVVDQYLGWAGGLLRGDLGVSLASGAPVLQEITPRLLNSLFLVGASMIISVPLSIVLGVFTAVQRDGIADRFLLQFSMIANAIPDFVLGLLLVVLFGTTVFHLFPPVALIPLGEGPLAHLDRMVLPVMTIVIMCTTYLYRLVRSSFIDVLGSEFIQMAELRGLGKLRILFLHALPNATGALIQASSISVAVILGGLVVIENVFNYNGIGMLLSNAIQTHDLPLMQGVILLIATAFFVCNFVADILAGERSGSEA